MTPTGAAYLAGAGSKNYLIPPFMIMTERPAGEIVDIGVPDA